MRKRRSKGEQAPFRKRGDPIAIMRAVILVLNSPFVCIKTAKREIKTKTTKLRQLTAQSDVARTDNGISRNASRGPINVVRKPACRDHPFTAAAAGNPSSRTPH